MSPPARRPNRPGRSSIPDAPTPELERGREAYARNAWRDAFEALSEADRRSPLEDQDLERLAWSAALAGHNDSYFAALERLHDLRVAAGQSCAASRAAFWLGLRLFALGEAGRAMGWLGRAERLIENEPECVERGYLLIPRAFAALVRNGMRPRHAMRRAGRSRSASVSTNRISRTSLACSRARRSPRSADHEAGLALLDEAMLAATRGLLSPLVTGILYCTVIGCCQRVFAIDRAREWTAALDAWCRSQPQLGHLHRRVPCASVGDHADPGSVAGGDRRGAQRRRAVPAAPPTRAALRPPSTSRGRSCGCAASSTRPNPRTGARASMDASPSRGLRCCDWRAGRPSRRPLRSARS